MRMPHIDWDDRGAVLVWVAGSLVTLMLAAALSIDLGWLYLNQTRLGAAADSAALAGVVNLPGFPADARLDALTASAANGFPVGGETTLADLVLAENVYQVTLTTDVETFFLPLIGMDEVTIRRVAKAEYIKPVRLGSPENFFGSPGSKFWAAINGRYTEIQQGDPYASQCITHNGSSGPPGCQGATNPLFRQGATGSGYYYAIEVPANSSSLVLRFYDGGHYVEGGGGDYTDGTSDPADSSWRWRWPSRGVRSDLQPLPTG